MRPWSPEAPILAAIMGEQSVELTHLDSSSRAERPRRAAPFIITPYVAGPNGRLTAQIPSCCPASADTAEAECRLVIVHHRHRKTGPQHPVTVMRCRTHGCAFTLYPPGYAPYRRQPVMSVAPDGAEFCCETDKDREETRFDETLFEGALDAKRGRSWMKSPSRHLPKRPSGTRSRHLHVAARIVGLASDLSDRVRLSIATMLSVSTMQLREGSRVTSHRRLGKAIWAVLARLRGGARCALKLLVCGHLVGRWGEPLHWDAQRQVLQRSLLVRPSTVFC